MPKIKLSPVQAGYFRVSRQNAADGMSRARLLDEEVAKIQERAAGLRRSAERVEQEMLAEVGREHGVEIPMHAQVTDDEGALVFEWEAAPKVQVVEADPKRAPAAPGNGAEKPAPARELRPKTPPAGSPLIPQKKARGGRKPKKPGR